MGEVKIVDDNNKVKHIYKSNNLIESSYKLSVAEQRLIYMGAKKLKPLFISRNSSVEETQRLMELGKFGEIEITVTEYKKEFNVRSNNIYKELKEISDGLFEKKIQYVEDDGKIVKKRWVITSTYDEKGKKVMLKFHPDLVMDLLVFKNKFTVLQYDVAKSIKNSYTYRIYELLKQYQNIGVRTFKLDDFRYKLSIPDDQYPKYANMKQKIINPSIKIINSKSDIEIVLEEKKEGRKVSVLTFFIANKIKTPKKVIQSYNFLDNPQVHEMDSPYNKLKDMLNMSITPQEAENVFDAALEGMEVNKLQIGALDYVEEKKTIIDEYAKYNQIGNYIGLLIKSLKCNWKSNSLENAQTSSFCDFDQRDYDFNELERKLLGWDED